MKDLFFQGGALFMGILTLLLLISFAWMIYHFIVFFNSDDARGKQVLRYMSYGRSIGLLALITGILGQLVGLHNAFEVLETTPVTPQMLAGGLKVSSIPTMYGMIIYILSLILWFGFSQMIENRIGDN